MNLQRILPCIALAALLTPATMPAQSPAHLHAGDSAPSLKFDQVFRSPDPYPQLEPALTGKTTVLVFMPVISNNPKAMSMWNDVVRHFDTKPIQFVLITSEKESSLRLWLSQNSVRGWVISDKQNQTARAYGLDKPTILYIAPDRKLLGFEQGITPKDQTIDAVLSGKTTDLTPQPR